MSFCSRSCLKALLLVCCAQFRMSEYCVQYEKVATEERCFIVFWEKEHLKKVCFGSELLEQLVPYSEVTSLSRFVCCIEGEKLPISSFEVSPSFLRLLSDSRIDGGGRGGDLQCTSPSVPKFCCNVSSSPIKMFLDDSDNYRLPRLKSALYEEWTDGKEVLRSVFDRALLVSVICALLSVGFHSFFSHFILEVCITFHLYCFPGAEHRLAVGSWQLDCLSGYTISIYSRHMWVCLSLSVVTVSGLLLVTKFVRVWLLWLRLFVFIRYWFWDHLWMLCLVLDYINFEKIEQGWSDYAFPSYGEVCNFVYCLLFATVFLVNMSAKSIWMWPKLVLAQVFQSVKLSNTMILGSNCQKGKRASLLHFGCSVANLFTVWLLPRWRLPALRQLLAEE